MAVYSMTGYASATAGATSAHLGEAQSETGGAKAQTTAGPLVSIELRSVNGRFLDLGLHLSDEFRALEPALRDLLGAAFRRGKIEFRLGTRSDGEAGWSQPQPEQLNRLARLESTVQGWLPKAQALSVHEILLWCKGSAPAERLDEPALEAARRCIAGLRPRGAGPGGPELRRAPAQSHGGPGAGLQADAAGFRSGP